LLGSDQPQAAAQKPELPDDMSTTAAPPPGSLVKRALQGSLLYSIPIVGQRLVGIFLLSIVTRVLTPDDYGMLVLIEQVFMILSTLLGGHFASALGYFYFENERSDHRAQVVGTVAAGAFGVGLVAMVVSLPLSGLLARYVFGSDAATRYLAIVFLSFPLNFLVEALFGWLRVTDRQRAFAGGSLLRVVLTASGIAILVGLLKYHVIAYVATTVGTLLIVAVVFSVYLFRATPLALSSPLFWRMLRFSLPLSLGFIAMFVINFGDQFVLRHYRPFAEVGIYGLAYRISMLVNVAISSFFSYWNAQVYSILRRDDSESVFARFLTYCALLVSFCALLLMLGARPGLRILVAEPFRPAAAIVPVLVAANSMRAIAEFLRTRFLAAGRPRYETYCTWIGMGICVGLYALLIPRYGMWGAASATALTFVVMGIVSVVWTQRVSPYRVEGARLVKLAALTGAIVFLYYAVPVSSFYWQAAWSTLLLAVFPAGLLLLRFADPGELRALGSLVRSSFSRLGRAESAAQSA
jgi:O-antigen/teichoic acid export membrane protein